MVTLSVSRNALSQQEERQGGERSWHLVACLRGRERDAGHE